MWKQVPYPPPRDPNPIGAPSDWLHLLTPTLELSFDPATGRFPALIHRRSGTSFLDERATGIHFRLLAEDGTYLDGARLGAPDHVRANPAGTSLTWSYRDPRLDGRLWPVHLTFTCSVQRDDELRFTYAIEHTNANRDVVERVQFPVFCGLREHADADTNWLLPFIGGERRPRPVSEPWSDFEYVYPNESFSFLDLYGRGEGLYLASYDPCFLWTVMRGRQIKLHSKDERAAWNEFAFETTPFLRPGERFESQPFALVLHAGDWHVAARRYRQDWMNTWWNPRATRAEVRELRGLVEVFFEIDDGERRTRMDAARYLPYLRRCRDELGFDVAHLCGYHEGGFDARYPLYDRPLEHVGGAEGLRALIERCHEEGFETDIYLNCRLMDVRTEWFADVGRDWACRAKDGTIVTEQYMGRRFAIADASLPERRALWLRMVRTLLETYGANGLQVDQPHTTARENWTGVRGGGGAFAAGDTEVHESVRSPSSATSRAARDSSSTLAANDPALPRLEEGVPSGSHQAEARRPHLPAQDPLHQGEGTYAVDATPRDSAPSSPHPFHHWGPGHLALFAEMRALLEELGERHWSWGEAASDVFAQFFDYSCCYTRFPDQHVFFGETHETTREWTYDRRGFGMPEVFRYLCPEIPLLQAPPLATDDPEAAIERLNLIWVFSALIYWISQALDYDLDRVPAFYKRYLKLLWDVRHEHRAVLVHGTFQDDQGFALEGSPDLYAKRYTSAARDAIVLLNRSRTQAHAATLTLTGPVTPLAATTLVLTEEGREERRAKAPVANLTLPPNRAAVVLFDLPSGP